VCVDPIALAESSRRSPPPLGPAATSVKVLHAARQDLEVLLPVVGAVGPVFDTQVAAALAGLPAQIGYGELVRRCSVELAKAHTRTDWSRARCRPSRSSTRSTTCAILLPLRERCSKRSDRSNRLAWLDEELARAVAANARPPSIRIAPGCGSRDFRDSTTGAARAGPLARRLARATRHRQATVRAAGSSTTGAARNRLSRAAGAARRSRRSRKCRKASCAIRATNCCR
jgi:ribonuclease D